MNRYEKLELILNNISNLNPDLTRRIHESGAIEDWIVEHALEKVSLQYFREVLSYYDYFFQRNDL